MAGEGWPTKRLAVTRLHLDEKNPRLGREIVGIAPREIVQHLFAYDKAVDVAESIASRGYFPNEPLLAVQENNRYIVIEGNRRLAALKALREPGLLEGIPRRQVERLSRQIIDLNTIARVPVTIAPSRRETDRQIAGRHVGTPVLAWRTENRASFILDKLDEGYDNDSLHDQLGFTPADIQSARLTRAIADMARSLALPEEVMATVESPRANVFTTLERVFDSSAGRDALKVRPDHDHGFRGLTTKKEFIRGFTKLVTDVALGNQSSRTLNKNEDIEAYFKSLAPEYRVAAKRGSFVPSDIIEGRPTASPPRGSELPKRNVKAKQENKAVLPRDLKVRFGNDRIIDIRRELGKLKRDKFPNAGAILLRVFFELVVVDYLRRTGEMKKIIARIEKKTGGRLRYDVPTMRELVPDITRVLKKRLSRSDANKVEKAITYNAAAPFTVSDLGSFVHQASELPTERDIQQFWLRTEPLFRLMLEQDPDAGE